LYGWKNIVQKNSELGSVTSELTELICERLAQQGQKTGVFKRISQDILDRLSQSFHCMKAFWVQMIDLGCCHGNQIMLGET